MDRAGHAGRSLAGHPMPGPVITGTHCQAGTGSEGGLPEARDQPPQPPEQRAAEAESTVRLRVPPLPPPATVP